MFWLAVNDTEVVRVEMGESHRGVIALGRVLSDPQIIELPAEYHRYCIDPALIAPQWRVRIRYIAPSGVPLWLDDDNSGTLLGAWVRHARK